MMPTDKSLCLPEGACDTHSHIYGDAARYPACPGQQAESNATLDDYLGRAQELGIRRHVFVQAKAYGPDPQCMLDGIARLGRHRARGIVMACAALGQADMASLHEAGIRGIRYLFPQGAPVDLAAIGLAAERAAGLGWSLLVQAGGSELAQACADLEYMPCPIVIDHLGRFPAETGTDDKAFRTVVEFIANGGWIKLAAPYYGTPDGASDFNALSSRVHAFLDAGAERVIWGMNWPHPNLPAGHKPDDAATLGSLLDILRSDDEKHAVLVDNPARLYGFVPAD
ncbi:amidohydrolase family protein [Pollutimonas sp. M17]|uniref:amidohydrolase family protein n=1 Tax=Pollutimonas sp. M17 TaxID=2962065 RepID=UPI0021F4912D|nr:amidohydrolase family protein [Pollutimonas sp. M17]UYO92578.1 amidohydrolase family protein [Pollutimonas sp. M17]